ncbi:MAG: SusC/RagA family TonB-linked outer membrane protein [Thalassobius sp.]|nr:SusC/RagA family TonB-linked outer membrane protein [Thalassovita sp.]
MIKSLQICFRLFCMSAFCLISQLSLAQERTITGTVFSEEDKSPLPGVSILLKGTSQGTVTDVDGIYRISVPSGATTLVMSYVGYETAEVEIGNNSVIDYTLKSSNQVLSEVIVTAVGIERSKKALGYAVTEIKGKNLAQKAESDVIRSLTGKIPGVNIQGSNGSPGASTNINIRGISSLKGSNQPLFVVDGIPFDNSSIRTDNTLVSGAPYANRASDIDPNDIESVSVLKGAAAAALYGERAANGVILITTKSGVSGSNKGLEVTLRSSYTIEKVAGIPELQNRFGQGGTTGGGSGIFSNAFFGSWGPSVNDLDSITDWQNNRVALRMYPDNIKDFFETGSNLENSISIRGGNEKANLVVTASNVYTQGMIPNSELVRTNIKVGGNAQLDNGLYIGGAVTYIDSDQQGAPTGGGGVVRSGFSTQLWYMPRSYDPYEYPYITENNEDNHYRSGEDHPLFSVYENPYTSRLNRVFANAHVGYDITDWLNVSYKIGMDAYNQTNKQVFAPSSQADNGIGSITQDEYYFRQIESNFLITAEKDINEDFHIRGTFGHNINQQESDREILKGTGIIVFGIDDIDNTQNVTQANNLISTYGKSRLVGVFGDISVDYRDYLFLGLTARNDWSSSLPPGNNSYFYPAATLGFIFTDAFNLQSKLLNYGKLRAAWGRVGRGAGIYGTQSRLYSSPNEGTFLGSVVFPFRGVPGLLTQGSLGNSNLKPEFTTEFEFGTELHFFNSRLTIDATYFDRTTTDLIFSVSRSPSSGFRSQVTNAGELTNKGIELGVNITPVKLTNSLQWDIFANFTKIDNKVTKLIDGLERLSLSSVGSNSSNFTSIGSYAVPGEPYGVIQGTSVFRDDEGNMIVDPSTGYYRTNPDVTVNIGNPNPDFILGIGNTISFKGISLYALVDWKQGGDLLSNTLSEMRGRGVLASTAEGDVRQQSYLLPGVIGDVLGNPILDENGEKIPNNIYIDANDYFWRTSSNAPSEFSIYDATVIRLREVSLGYTLPSSLLTNTFIGSATINLIGRNLWFNAPNMPDGFDPETSGQGSGNIQGVEYAYVPNAKRYGVSLQVTF